MKYTVQIVFGQEQVIKVYNGEPLTEEEIVINRKDYSFETLEEEEAFTKGIDEAVGWMEYCIPSDLFS